MAVSAAVIGLERTAVVVVADWLVWTVLPPVVTGLVVETVRVVVDRLV